MTYLITLLISLLGYGTPSDFSHMSESELQHEISALESDQDSGDQDSSDGGQGDVWDHAGVQGPTGE